MNVLVDTSVWSLSLRRRAADLRSEDQRLVAELSELIRESRVCIVGPVRQELLSGIREVSQFERIRDRLRNFLDLTLTTGDYEQAAVFDNQCRRHGISGSGVDFLLCAVAARNRWSILTLDADFRLYARHIPIAFHVPRKSL